MSHVSAAHASLRFWHYLFVGHLFMSSHKDVGGGNYPGGNDSFVMSANPCVSRSLWLRYYCNGTSL